MQQGCPERRARNQGMAKTGRGLWRSYGSTSQEDATRERKTDQATGEMKESSTRGRAYVSDQVSVGADEQV